MARTLVSHFAVRQGPGGFLKAHQDTPHATNMFGSLVLVLPSFHEGGALLIRHAGKQWSIESASQTKNQHGEPAITYAAFYGDVEHEVIEVIAGNRITLTYNPFLHPEDNTFLPEDGRIGFGLSHQYPMNLQARDSTERTRAYIRDVHQRLRGSDGGIWRALHSVGLAPSVRVVHQTDDDVLLVASGTDVQATLDELEAGSMPEETSPDEILSNGDAVTLNCAVEDRKYYGSKTVEWATRCKMIDTVECNFPALIIICGKLPRVIEGGRTTFHLVK
ncbi:hypothetical protein C8R44DRAFT_739974 [Mycena epipterygia]|nr:hypothetical protein C8R44DRAFT_739974 [Mycena epipterygia]